VDETVVRIELGGEPIGKGRPRFSTHHGYVHAYTPAKTVQFEKRLKDAALAVMGRRRPFEGALSVFVMAVYPVRDSWPKWKRRDALAQRFRPTTRPDVDNILKVLDALNSIVFVDDVQIVDAHIIKFYGAKPRLLIEIKPLDEAIRPAAADVAETQAPLPLGASQ